MQRCSREEDLGLLGASEVDMELQNPKKRAKQSKAKSLEINSKDLKRRAKGSKAKRFLEEFLRREQRTSNIMEHLELMMFMAEPPDCTADMVTSPTSPSLKGGLLRRNYIIFKI